MPPSTLGLYKDAGMFVIGLSFIGFLAGVHEFLVLSDVIILGLATLGIIVGIYLGSLGAKVEELENMDYSYLTRHEVVEL